MFKKLMLTSAILAIGTTSAFAAGTGPYVGGSLDANYSLFKDETNNAFVNSTGNFGKVAPGATLFAGYGKLVKEKFYLGGEVFGSVTHSDLDGLEGVRHVSFDTHSSFGASLIPGVMLSDSTMAYARLGVVKTKFEVTDTINNTSDSTKETVSGGQAGVGLQTQLTSKLDLRGEYDFTKYNSFDTDNNTSKISPTSGQMKLGLVYNIG